MDFFFLLQCSSPSAEGHFRFPVVVTGVTTFSAEQCPAAPEDDGPEKGRLSLSRPSGLLVMTMYLKYEVREVREKALSRSSDVDPRFRSVSRIRYSDPYISLFQSFLLQRQRSLYMANGGLRLVVLF